MTTENFHRGLIAIGLLALLMVVGNLILSNVVLDSGPAPSAPNAAPIPAAPIQEAQGRPGVIRSMGSGPCYHVTNTSEQRELSRTIPEISCDDRYKDAEEIAYWEFQLKDDLKTENSPGHRAYWEAWQASAASGATTLMGRLEANTAEIWKLAEQHADLSRPFLHGGCHPWTKEETANKEVLKDACKYHEKQFELKYWLALQGDHQAQEGIADCFNYYGPAPAIQNCNRVVDRDENMMCAWYLVAASSGHPESSKSAEKYGYIEECDKKPIYERQAILGTASALFLRIYQRPMSVAR
jgi:hypothetical protein